MEDPLGQTPEKSYLGVFHLKWHIKCFYFYFLGGVLRVIYNSDTFEKWGLKVHKLKLGIFCVFFRPPPFPKLVCIKVVTPPITAKM